MMRLLFLFIGILLCARPVDAAMPLYDRIKQTIERETGKEEIDPPVAAFVAAVLSNPSFTITTGEVTRIVRGEGQAVCGARANASVLDCDALIDTVERLVEREERIRALGRSLQAIATSYELPISDLPGRALSTANDLRGIQNIWGAGTGSIKIASAGPPIRIISADPDTFRTLFTDIGESLETLPEEERIAAVWRYQYGVRLVRGERAPRFPAPYIDSSSGPGTERQYLFKRWDALEEALIAVWNLLLTATFDPPLGTNETVYYTIPANLLDETMPDNIMLWMHIDGNPAESHPFGDVGLQWSTPLEPVLPSLQSETGSFILGGRYPPEPAVPYDDEMVPIDGAGLCSSPTALRGYLCRPYEQVPPELRCPKPDEPVPPDTIELRHCLQPPAEGGVWCCLGSGRTCRQVKNTGSCSIFGGVSSDTPEGCSLNGCRVPKGATRVTIAGPDTCRELTWKDAKPFDINRQCKLELRCAPSCAPGMDSFTLLKDGTGVVRVCVNENTSGPATYAVYRALVRAYQFCKEPPSKTPTEPYRDMTIDEATRACCRGEGEANQAVCAMMERDGMFEAGANYEGVPFNAETCAETLTHWMCSQNEMKGCYLSRFYPAGFPGALFGYIDGRNPSNVPDLCTDATHGITRDPRIAAMKETIEKRDDLCDPGQVNQYKNRIGNNLCYIGQCVEQSEELHRLGGARTPATVSDELTPWDSALTGTPLGNLLMNPPIIQGQLPTYRPGLLIRTVEQALCQLQGLPPRTPPILCAINPVRQLREHRTTGMETVFGLLTQEEQYAVSAEDLLTLSPAIGSRIGTSLYGTYLRDATRSFAGVLTIANRLLNELTHIAFPIEMCPISPNLPPAS